MTRMTDLDLRDINLRTLKRIDPTIGDIIESSSQSALYTFDDNSDKWIKQDYEGCLHLFERKSFSLSSNQIKLNTNGNQPKYGFVILDSGSRKHYAEDIKPNALVQMIDTSSLLGVGPHNLLMFTSITGVVHCFWFNSFDECEKMLLAMKSVASSSVISPTNDCSNGSDIFHFGGDTTTVNNGPVANGGRDKKKKSELSSSVDFGRRSNGTYSVANGSSPVINGARVRTTSGSNSKNHNHNRVQSAIRTVQQH